MNDRIHPAESAEFLSRLHDHELSPTEARDFDAHRASCAACRDAVEEFERSLSAFRASPTAAPASDLSARILRKIREQSPSRRPFGVTFGIDIRWAGVLAAALLMAIIVPALLHKDERFAASPAPAYPDALPAYLLEEKTKTAENSRKENAAPAPKAPAAAPEVAVQGNVPLLDKTNASPAEKDAGRDLAAAQTRPEARREGAVNNEFAQAPPKQEAEAQAAAPAPSRGLRRQTASAPGGEAGGAVNTFDLDRVSVHLSVSAMDGYGDAPAVQETPTDDALANLSGREFILLVETGGRVRDVSPSTPASAPLRKDGALDERLKSKKDGAELMGLRFAPSDRPRRLLVKVE